MYFCKNNIIDKFLIIRLMGWKDYFYFEKRDKNSIILLLILIVMSAIIYVLLQNNTHYINPEQELIYQNEFNSLQGELSDKKQNPAYHTTKLIYGKTIELNKSDTTELKKIPGIGSVFANRIVKYRNSLGGYVSAEQLKEVWGIDEELYNKIQMYLTVESNPQKLKVNKLGLDQLKSHPYINYKQAKVIIDLRERKRNLTSINRLALLEEFTQEDIERLKPYLSFD